MATNDEYEYEYEYELPNYAVNKSYNKVEQDPLIDAMRNGDFGEHPSGEKSIPIVWPNSITLYTDLKTDTQQQQYYSGIARGDGRTFFLDAYPHSRDYRYAAPGGVIKNTVLYWLDEIHTEGRLTKDTLLQFARPGKVTWVINDAYRITANNVGFIWVPGDRKRTNKMWWFVEDQQPEQYILLKKQNKLTWSPR